MKLIAIFTRVMCLSTKLSNNDQKFCHQFATWWQKVCPRFFVKKRGASLICSERKGSYLKYVREGPGRMNRSVSKPTGCPIQNGRCRRQCRKFEESNRTIIQTRVSAANVYFLFLLDDFPDCLLGNIAVLLYVLISFGKGPSLEKRL